MAEETEVVKEEVKKQAVIAVFMLVSIAAAVWLEYKIAEEMGTHEHAARWQAWWDRRRRAAELEETVRRDMSKVMFEVSLVLGYV